MHHAHGPQLTHSRVRPLRLRARSQPAQRPNLLDPEGAMRGLLTTSHPRGSQQASRLESNHGDAEVSKTIIKQPFQCVKRVVRVLPKLLDWPRPSISVT